VCAGTDQDHYGGYYMSVGPPLPPALTISQPSPLEIQVLWDEPFTSQNYPVLNYTVEITKLATGSSVVFTSSTPDHTQAVSSVATECREIKIEVWATNAVGKSDPAAISTGFPVGRWSLHKFSVVMILYPLCVLQ